MRIERKKLKACLLAETQAIAIYEAECRVLRATAFTAGRRKSYRLCEEILCEERGHREGLEEAENGLLLRFELSLSRWAGYALGTGLSLIPSRLSWKAHELAERQAAWIYREAGAALDPLRAEAELLAHLRRAESQENEHADRFAQLLMGKPSKA